MVAATRKSHIGGSLEVNPAAVADVLKVLARHNPGLSKPALVAAGKVMAVVSAAAARLPSSSSGVSLLMRQSWPILWRPPSRNWRRSRTMRWQKFRSKGLLRSAAELGSGTR